MTTDPSGSESILSDRRVLVTGGAGFIGSHLVDALVEHNDVHVLDHLSSGSRDQIHPDATLHVGDVRDEQTVAELTAEVDVVFHQAGLVSVAESTADPIASQSANVAGTVTVLDAARRTDTRVVAASSAAVYGDPETVPIPEDAELAPRSPYGVDKLAVDHYTRLFEELYGLPTVALRYFNVYGPGQGDGAYSGVVGIFLDRARADEPLTVHGTGSQTRDFVHVSDVVRANLLAARTSSVGRAFNVGTGRKTSVETLARTVRRVADSEAPIVHEESRPGDVEESVADLTAARTHLGYEPRLSLPDGLATMIDTPSRG